LLIAVSYPAIFVASGIGLALSPVAIASRRRSVRLGWAVYGVVVTASFLTVYFSNAVFQAVDIREEYRTGCWAESFPPLDRPWAVPLWLVDVHAGTMMAYPAGEKHGGSAVTLLCVAAGVVALWRGRRKSLLRLLLAPLGLGLLAAFLGRYPYGGAPRIMLYSAPSLCMLAGLGLALLLDRLPRQRDRRRAWVGVVAGLTVLGGGLVVRDLCTPYRTLDDQRTREFARWFWTEKPAGSDLVCMKSDIGLSSSRRQWRVGMSAVYLFHQRRFSDRHRGRRPTDLDPWHYSASRPLRLVEFDHLPADSAAFHGWLGALSRSFELVRTDTYVIQPGKPTEDWLRDAYVVLEWIPRRSAVSMSRGGEGQRRGRRL
jgi:hypothetical protein